MYYHFQEDFLKEYFKIWGENSDFFGFLKIIHVHDENFHFNKATNHPKPFHLELINVNIC